MSDRQQPFTWDSASSFWEQNLQGILSRNGWYEAINRGEVPHIRIGRRILVRSDVLDQMLSDVATSDRQTVPEEELASDHRDHQKEKRRE